MIHVGHVFFRQTLLGLAAIGLLAALTVPSAALAACLVAPAGDADCDGLADATDPCPTDTLNRCLGPTVALCGTGSPQECTAGADLRLDIGNTAPKTDCNADVWGIDAGPGTDFNSCCGAPTLPPATTISAAFGCSDVSTQQLVASEKFIDPLTRSYPIANGKYIVNLLFAEAFGPACTVGFRTMDISLEGSVVYGGPAVGDGFDQYKVSLAQNGAADACGGLVVRSAVITVADGTLDLVLDEDDPTGDPNAALKAIEVLEHPVLCPGGDPAPCDDGNPCTSDVCNTSNFCENNLSPATTPCNLDANVCTIDECDGLGSCVSTGGLLACDDLNGCTTDSCDPIGGCQATPFGPGAWGSRANTLFSVHEHTMLEAGGLLFKISGEETTAVEVFDPAGGDPAVGQWTDIGAPFPLSPTHHLQGVVVGGVIYVPGGLTGFPGPARDTLFALDTNNLAAGWVQLASMPPFPGAPDGTRGAMGCAAQAAGPSGVAGIGAGPFIYCAGGLQGGSAVDHFQVYDIGLNQWFNLPAMPAGNRDHMEAVAVGGRIYVIGGRVTTIPAIVNDNEMYDPATNSWGAAAPLPTARGGHTLALLDGKIVALGGEGSGSPSGIFPEVEIYNPNTDDWCTNLAPLPTPVHSSATVALGSLVYQAAGGTIQGFSNSVINHVFALALGADSDGDGSASPVDCDDNDSGRTPFAPELCDGIDNDCDGEIDEGNPEAGAACSTGLLGVCNAGTETCQGGALVCVADNSPSAEVCDGLDNDCDGTVDEGNPGGGAGCSTGLPGACDAGTEQCQGGALVCVADSSPSAEVCDGLDNDCDGTVDEGNPGGGGSCDTGDVGACAAGLEQCQGGALVCVPVAGPSPETCNNVDDDCDGAIDEGNPGGGAVCTTGQPGICDAGTIQCTGGDLVCEAVATSQPEVCNGLDDNCDGQVDEGDPDGGALCSTGLLGVCDAGIEQCQGGALVCVPDTAPAAEVCASGVDEDCDGQVDEPENCIPCLPADTIELTTQTRRNVLKLRTAPNKDQATIKGRLIQPLAEFIAPDVEEVFYQLTDGLGTFYQGTIPAGNFVASSTGRKFKYKDKSSPFENGGIKISLFSAKTDLVTTKYKVKAVDLELPSFVGIASTITVKIGETCYFDSIDSCTTKASGAVKCQ